MSSFYFTRMPMTNRHISSALTILLLFVVSIEGWGQTEKDTLAHFMCVWPAKDVPFEQGIRRLRALHD